MPKGRYTLNYIQRQVTMTINFPEDMVICDVCDFCRSENNGTRFRCMLTSEILPYHNKVTGLRCPLFPVDVDPEEAITAADEVTENEQKESEE